MNEPISLVEHFEANRSHLRAVAYRMLGSLAEADDAVQETWLRVGRATVNDVVNLTGWLTTVVARICLDMLRARTSRREESLDTGAFPQLASRQATLDPEQEALLADRVGVALLVVLERLTPAERLAFVLHDVFAVPFEDIAPIVERTPAAARKLASRARQRLRGGKRVAAADLVHQRIVVDAFLASARAGDFAALLAVLDPQVVLRADRAAAPAGVPLQVRGAEVVAKRALAGRSGAAQRALVNGAVGVVVAQAGRLHLVLAFTIRQGKIVALEVIADPERLEQLDLATDARGD